MRSDLAIQSHTRTLSNHVRDCPLQMEENKQRVKQYREELAQNQANLRSPQAARVQQTVPESFHSAAIPGPSFHNYQPESISLNSPPNPFISSNLPSEHHIDPQIRFHPYLRPGSSDNPMSHSPPSSIYLNASGNSSADSISPFDSISMGGASASRMNSQPPSRPASRVGQVTQALRRRGSYVPGIISQDTLAPNWSAARKKAFEKRILRLTASAGFPLSWTENLEWRLFCEEFVTGAPTISRKVLTKRILKEVVEDFRMEVKKKVENKEATIQSDGWTGINNHHLVAFMITADKKVCGVQGYFPIRVITRTYYLIW